MDSVEWLLDSDPAIRWQAMRDLTEAPTEAIAAERARVSREGFGAEILARQDPDGAWRSTGKPAWLPTLFTVLLLRATGVDPNDPSVESAISRLDSTLGWNDKPGSWDLRPMENGTNPFFAGEVEPCINGGVLALGGYFGRPTESLALRLVSEQLDDGGWNCDAPPSRRSSFHTTICVLEGLLEYERAVGSAPDVSAVRKRGEEYLLERDLFRRRSTGEIANEEFLELAFPPRYHYDILRALDHFRNAGAEPDDRMHDALQLVDNKRLNDGRWNLDRSYDEALGFRFSEIPGETSRWNTLRALRVKRWIEHNGTFRCF